MMLSPKQICPCINILSVCVEHLHLLSSNNPLHHHQTILKHWLGWWHESYSISDHRSKVKVKVSSMDLCQIINYLFTLHAWGSIALWCTFFTSNKLHDSVVHHSYFLASSKADSRNCPWKIILRIGLKLQTLVPVPCSHKQGQLGWKCTSWTMGIQSFILRMETKCISDFLDELNWAKQWIETYLGDEDLYKWWGCRWWVAEGWGHRRLIWLLSITTMWHRELLWHRKLQRFVCI